LTEEFVLETNNMFVIYFLIGIERDTGEGKCLNYIFSLPFFKPNEVNDLFVFNLIVNDMPFNEKIVQYNFEII
jgi:hypothetical protein